MCLAVPGKVTAIDSSQDPLMGTVDFSGVRKSVCLAYVPEISVGDYVVVHVGFALGRLDEGEALETLQLLRDMGAAPDVPPDAPGQET
jgi:hydrogenase expression/formation protein HypC